MRKLGLILGLFIATQVGYAQKYYLTNQYVYDLFQMNPAAAAFHKNCFTATGIFQKQWFGTDLAPTYQVFSFQIPIMEQMGSGTYVYSDRNGYYKEMGLHQAFSYELQLKKTKRRAMTLSFGLAFTLEQSSLHMSELMDPDYFDPILNGGNESGWGFNASTGLLLKYNDYHLGIGITNLLPQNNPMYRHEDEPPLTTDIHIHAGSSFKIPDRDFYLEPSFLYRRNMYVDSRLDANLKLYMPTPDPDWATWGLVSYRHTTEDKIGKSLGMAVTGGVVYKNFSVGLEYQFGLTKARSAYGNTYQLVVNYRICRDKSKSAIPCSIERRNKKHNYKFLSY